MKNEDIIKAHNSLKHLEMLVKGSDNLDTIENIAKVLPKLPRVHANEISWYDERWLFHEVEVKSNMENLARLAVVVGVWEHGFHVAYKDEFGWTATKKLASELILTGNEYELKKKES